MSRRASMIALLAGAIALFGAAATSASAACPVGFVCETVGVPLDHADPAAGSLELEVARHEASAGEGKPLLLFFPGGPGVEAISYGRWMAERFAPALRRYQLVVFDPRGTGASALRCPWRQRLGEFAPLGAFVAATARCGERLGEAAGRYQTQATVEDIETIRAALGADRVAIYGVSYGTNVGQRYLLAHPDRLEALVLDSVVGPGGLDPLSRSNFRAIARVLRALQPGTGARTRELVRRVRRAPLRGTVVGPDGRPRPAQIDDPLDILSVILAGDGQPSDRREYPAAVRAALDGDPSALLRMHASGAGPDTTPVSISSAGLYAATTCTDTRMPYGLGSDPGGRAALVRAAVAALPRRAYGPFDRATVYDSSVAAICQRWPALALEPQSLPGAYPAVPTLVVNGSSDTSTPDADARAVASRIPGASLITLAGTGHSVLSSDRSGCTVAAANRLLLGRGDLPTCDRVDNGLDEALARMPLALRDFAPQPEDGGRAGRALAAVRATINDALGHAPNVARGEAGAIGGLHGGRAVVRLRADGTQVYRLSRYRYLPDLAVTGKVVGRRGTMRSRGLIRGRLVLRPQALLGRFGGRTVRQPR